VPFHISKLQCFLFFHSCGVQRSDVVPGNLRAIALRIKLDDLAEFRERGPFVASLRSARARASRISEFFGQGDPFLKLTNGIFRAARLHQGHTKAVNNEIWLAYRFASRYASAAFG